MNGTACARPSSGLWDAVSVIIGIVVGAGIYETEPLAFANTGDPAQAIKSKLGAMGYSLGGAERCRWQSVEIS